MPIGNTFPIFTFENDSSGPDTPKPEKIKKKFWSFHICDRVSTQSKKLKDAILVAFGRGSVGWKMVYNFLGIDEKT